MVNNEVKAIVKWPGGKSSEADNLLPLIPDYSGRFIDPFVGGGAILFSQLPRPAEANDLSGELIGLYNAIKQQDQSFFSEIGKFEKGRSNLKWIDQEGIREKFLDIFRRYSLGELDKSELKTLVHNWVLDQQSNIVALLPLSECAEIFVAEVTINIVRKIIRVDDLQNSRGTSLGMDLIPNMETALHSAYYMYIRYLYNKRLELKLSRAKQIAAFYYLREFCYSSMFRFNKQGEFNVPYGGMAYNNKDFEKKIASLRPLKRDLCKVRLHSKDFEDFLIKVKPRRNDFVFLDPPYDTEFSEYDGNEFGREDHERLADLLSNLESSFLLVIKNTPFVRQLYGTINGVETRVFDKQYTVSFQNRNDQSAKHLVFTNYKPAMSFS